MDPYNQLYPLERFLRIILKNGKLAYLSLPRYQEILLKAHHSTGSVLPLHSPYRVLDNASFHGARRLQLPENMVWIFQPSIVPSSIRSNAFGSTWKEQLSWVLFSTLGSLRQSVTDILHELTPQTIRSLIAYPFTLSALKHVNI